MFTHTGVRSCFLNTRWRLQMKLVGLCQKQSWERGNKQVSFPLINALSEVKPHWHTEWTCTLKAFPAGYKEGAGQAFTKHLWWSWLVEWVPTMADLPTNEWFWEFLITWYHCVAFSCSDLHDQISFKMHYSVEHFHATLIEKYNRAQNVHWSTAPVTGDGTNMNSQ